MGKNQALSSGILGAQLASLRFVAVHFTPPITTRHFAKLSFYCMFFFFKALLILESCLSKMLKIKTVFALEAISTIYLESHLGKNFSAWLDIRSTTVFAGKPAQVFLVRGFW